MKKKVVLAYSGGLDTTFCILYLIDQGYEVHAVTANTGGFSSKDIVELRSNAFNMGAASFECIDIRETYYNDCIRFLIFGNILRNRNYPLCVSSERVFQANAILNYALDKDINVIAHGSTGAGNDQIRFDTVFLSHTKDFEILTPIRDQKLSRQEEIDFIRSKGYNWDQNKKEYSVNIGLWGNSIGGKETLGSRYRIPENAFTSQVEEKESKKLEIAFENGEPIALNGHKYDSKVDLISELNKLGSRYGIGRDIHVGDTIIGIKGRVAFEAPGASLIISAHHLLEKHTLSKWQNYWKNQLSEWYGMFVHEGKYFDPVMRNIEAFLKDSQKFVNGNVYITLYPYRYEMIGIDSPNDLMNSKFGKYGEENNGWSGEDVKGFTKIFSNPDLIFQNINGSND